MMKVCQSCKNTNDDDAKFCTFCGGALENAQSCAESALPVLIENDTPFTKQTLKNFYKNNKISAIVCLIASVFILICGILELIWERDPFFFIIACVFLICSFSLFWAYNKLTKDSRFSENTHQLYRFDERGMAAIFYEGTQKTGDIYIPYDKFTKVKKQKNFIVVFFGNSAYIIDTGTFTKGTEYDLKQLLLSKCPPDTVKLK